MNKNAINSVAALATIVAVIVAILAFLRDLFDFTLPWSPVVGTGGAAILLFLALIFAVWISPEFRSRVRQWATDYRFWLIIVFIVFGLVLWSLYRIQILTSIVADRDKQAEFSYATQTAQTARIDELESNSAQAIKTPVTRVVTVTRVVEVTPTVDDRVLPIEAASLHVFAYGGEGDPEVGQGSGVLTIEQNGNSNTDYKLDYTLPDEGEGYAGLAIRFPELLNLRAYEFIEVTIRFGDEETKCDLGIRDFSGAVDYVRLGESIPSNSDITVSVAGNRQTIKIPLQTNFDAINLTVVKEIIFNVGTHFSRGTHTFTVSEVKFLMGAVAN